MKSFIRLLIPLIAIAWTTPSEAALIMEPVINFVSGVGPSADSIPIYDPTFVNVANGEHPFLAHKPGQIDTVSIGFPADADLLTFSIWNNTSYNLTSLKLSIIGSATHPTGSQEAWLVTLDPSVDAHFGDANGDGNIGLSDIFSSIIVSDGGKTITLSGGIIPANSHFTDIVFSFTTDGLPFDAAVDTSFDGVRVPEPVTLAVFGAGLAGIVALRRRKKVNGA